MRIEPGFKGILAIGDPHLSSVRPGRRIDDYETAVLRKLAACAEICRAENLFPLILGDLFHRAGENSLRLLNRLAEVLDQFPVTPLTVEGNHDHAQSSLTEVDALALLAKGGHIQVASETGTAIVVEGVAEIVCVPHGCEIPDSVEAAGTEPVLLVTHHDLAFNGAYPGAALLKEVAGVRIAVNGHMHKCLPPAQVGQTRWLNPGNISRVTVDDRDHVPRAWRLLAGAEDLDPVPLPFEPAVFDLTGHAAILEGVAPVAPSASLFSQMLATQDPLAAARTDDGEILKEDLMATAASMKGLNAGVLQVLLMLLDGNPATVAV